MSVERTFEKVIGSMVLLSAALTYFVHPGFIWMTAFVGANVIQQSFTGFCPVAWGLRRAGMKTERQLGKEQGC